MSRFFTINIISLKSRSIIPSFYSLPMLKIIFPFSFIFSSIYMNISAITICFIHNPLTFKYISINMIKFSFSMSFIISPFTLITSSIWPSLFPISITHIPFPFTVVYCTTFKSIKRSFFSMFWVL
jgi:hypothetical protein